MARQGLKRERIVKGRFSMRVAVSTSRVGPTKVEVFVWHGSILDTLRFWQGPSLEELRSAVAGYAALLATFAGRTWSPERHNPHSEQEARSLQNAASSLFRSLFRDNAARTRKLLDDLSFYLDHPNLTVIRFDSDLPGIPFDALHYGKSGSLDPKRYFAVRAPILHVPFEGDAAMQENETVSIGFLGTRNVSSVGIRDTKSIFKVFDDLGRSCEFHEHTPLRDAGNEMHAADLAALFRELGQPRSVWHITSHMQDVGGQRYFVLDNELEVRPADLSSYCPDARQFLGQPLVFLNLCSGATPNAVGESFPEKLHSLEAGGIIATHCLLNERFATHFAGRFYRHALGHDIANDEPSAVGASLFLARKESLQDDGSLASLCYSFHALDDFALAPSRRQQVKAVSA